MNLLSRRIKDENILWLLKQIIISFSSEHGQSRGIPLGNLTSQIFANIYLNELDQFAKHRLKIRYYLRYADDFLILSSNKEELELLITKLTEFLKDKLKLELHPKKINLRKLDWGTDFLGYIVLPYYKLPRTKTKRRILKKTKEFKISEQLLNSYLGYFSHANAFKVEQELKNLIWFFEEV